MTCVNGFRGLRNPPKRIAVERTNLTAKERALLPDPQWVTEDDADAITMMREEKKAGERSYSLEQVLREYGLTLERSNPARCPPATSPRSENARLTPFNPPIIPRSQHILL
jgi:hypothetical protein